MKTEMKIMPNGNYDEVISPIQHKCESKDYVWECIEYGWDLGKLQLNVEDGDLFEGGYSSKIEVNYCPFCGYQSEHRKT